MDAIVDRQFGEPVEFRPWKNSGVRNEGEPDPSRDVVKTVGIEVTLSEGSAITGGKQFSNSVWVSVEESVLGDLASWKKYDRIVLPERPAGQNVFMWDHALPGATGRIEVFMTRLSPVSPP
jgi:hypothetical protein